MTLSAAEKAGYCLRHGTRGDEVQNRRGGVHRAGAGKSKEIEAALLLISAQRTCAELVDIGVLSDSFNRANDA